MDKSALLGLLGLSLAGVTSATAFAQSASYPNKAIRWVLPFLPGGYAIRSNTPRRVGLEIMLFHKSLFLFIYFYFLVVRQTP